MEKISDRIKKIAENEGISLYALEKKINASKGVLYISATKGTDVNSKWLSSIIKLYPKYSSEWLLTGEGNMIKNSGGDNFKIVQESKITDRIIEQKIKLYPLEASANLNTIFCDDNTETDYIYIPNAPKCDAAIYVRGDSMTPIINSGDIVAYKNINSLDYLQYGQMYLVHFELDGDYFLVIKYVRKSDKQGYVRLESQNTFHQPQEIPLSAIRNIALIKLSIRQNTQF